MNYYYEMDEERDKFIKEKEERFGGSITFISFARLLGFSKPDCAKNLNGLMFIINDVVYFEDFKPRPSPLLMYSDKDFTKFEFNIALDQITSVTNIKESEALSCVKGTFKFTDIAALTGSFTKLFHKSVSMFITTNNREAVFFDISEIKRFPVG